MRNLENPHDWQWRACWWGTDESCHGPRHNSNMANQFHHWCARGGGRIVTQDGYLIAYRKIFEYNAEDYACAVHAEDLARADA